VAEGGEELEILDAALQFVGDLFGAGDEVVDFEEALFFCDVEGEGHDQRVRQRFQADRGDFGDGALLGEEVEVLLRQLREPHALRVGGAGVALDLPLRDHAREAVRLARDFVEDSETRLAVHEDVVAAVVERHRLFDVRHGAAGVYRRCAEVSGLETGLQ